MSVTLISWHLAELMAGYRVKGSDLAERLGVSDNAISSMKRSRTMPRITGERLNELLMALNDLADPQAKQEKGEITLAALMNWNPDES